MTTPVNEFFITLEKPLEDTIVLENGLVLYKNPLYDVDWNVTCQGKLAAIPPKLKKKYTTLKEGDTVCISFDVVSDRAYPADDDVFYPATEPNPYLKKWINGRQELLQLVAINTGKLTLDWVCTYTDVNGNLLGGIQDKERHVDRFLAQFNFSDNRQFIFKNLLETPEGKDVWRVDQEQLLAKLNEDGSIEPLSDCIIMTPYEEDVKTKLEIMNGGKPLPYQNVSLRYYDRAILAHDAPDLDLKKGDMVSFSEQYLCKYEFFNKQYFVIPSRRALGIWSDDKQMKEVQCR